MKQCVIVVQGLTIDRATGDRILLGSNHVNKDSASQYRNFCKGYVNGEKAGLSMESKKKNVGNHTFFRDI